MHDYRHLKEELLDRAGALLNLLERARGVPGVADAALNDWQRTCRQSHRQLTDAYIRVAVVGPIKSGKSTFTNALLGRDYLKRGAGIVTSIVTRIRQGEHLEARLHLKSWEEINNDLARAMVLLPTLQQRLAQEPFDIRRQRDRADLAAAFTTLNRAALIADGTQDAHSVLIACYLDGYDRVAPLITGQERIVRFRGEHFSRHREFVGEDRLSAYLNDVELEIDAVPIDAGVEIADCQGSDSPNPHHLAMIQDYMLQTHLIVYVISSRTGLRQADFRFLSIIRKMGIAANMLFVLNCDFNEHASLADLTRLVERIGGELTVFHPDPQLFTLSALYQLFQAQAAGRLTAKEEAMLAHWRAEPELVEFSEREMARFRTVFQRKMVDERRILLLGNHIARMAVVAGGLGRWARLHREALGRDADQTAVQATRIDRHRRRIEQVRALVRDTLDGTGVKLRGEVRREVDRFFSPHAGTLIGDTLSFVRRYSPETAKYHELIAVAGFSSALYRVFQDFRQALEGYLAEVVTPEILRFLSQTEARLLGQMDDVARPFAVMARETLADLDGTSDASGAEVANGPALGSTHLDIEGLKQCAGLKVPSAVAPLRFTARIRTEAVARLGFYTVVEWARRAMKKPAAAPTHGGGQALLDALKRIKRETAKGIDFHFKSHRENIKFQYLFKLLDAAAGSIQEAIYDQLRAYGDDLSQLAERVASQGAGRQQVAEHLAEIEAAASTLGQRLEDLRQALNEIQAVD